MHVFAYGTLMAASVMRAVAGREYDRLAASLTGYGRYRLIGEPFPGLIREHGSTTDGVLYLDVDGDSLVRLDAFEGKCYQRVRVRVLAETGAMLPAETYAISDEHRHRVSGALWDFREFQRRDLAAFLERYQGFNQLVLKEEP